MAKQSTHTPYEIDDKAEGSPRNGESPEPSSPLKTRTVPVVKSDTNGQLADTGMVQAVNVSAEGHDADEAQDASLTTEETKKPQPATTAEATPAEARKVLLVEDNTDLAEVITATLSRMNMETTHETHGGKAIERLGELSPDVVLLDIGLPDMTGWKILDALKEKQEKGQAALPITIVITAYGDPANRLVGKLQGIQDYLVKPFTPDEIEGVVKKALGD